MYPLRIWQYVLSGMLVFYCYHLIRDIVQDVLGLRHPLTDILHYSIDPARLPAHLVWLNFGGYRKYSSFPIEILLLILIPLALRRGKFTALDVIIILVNAFFVLSWILATPYSTPTVW
jgi:hypothetical protein